MPLTTYQTGYTQLKNDKNIVNFSGCSRNVDDIYWRREYTKLDQKFEEIAVMIDWFERVSYARGLIDGDLKRIF